MCGNYGKSVEKSTRISRKWVKNDGILENEEDFFEQK